MMRSGAKPSILVVEDEKIIAMDLVSSLKKLCYPVVGIAASGEEAISLTESKAPDLILMDVHLRGTMNGIEAAEKIHQKSFVPIVYLTAYADDSTFDHSRVTYPFGYVVKPFNVHEIEVSIQTALYHHKVEQNLRESEQRLHAILGSIGDGVIATDADQRITFLNRAAEALLGVPSEQAKGRLLSELLPGQAPPDGLLRVGKDDTPVERIESRVNDAGRGTMGYVTVLRDFSERLRAQEARDREMTERAARVAAERERERARLKAEISLALGDIMEAAEHTTALRQVTNLIARDLGGWCVLYSGAPQFGVRLIAHKDPEQVALAEEMLQCWPPRPDEPRGAYAVIRTGHPEWLSEITEELLAQVAQDQEHLKALQALRLSSYLCVPLRAHRRIIGALACASTEPLRRYKEADVSFLQQIADRIALAIENARLFQETRASEERQARLVTELERAVRFSDLFIGILGHDLRNPLSGITTSAGVIFNRVDDEDILRPLRRILNSAARMSRMIDQILDFTHVRLGRGIPLMPKTFDLAEVCRQVLDELRREGNKATDIQLTLQGDTWGTWDEDRLAQLISNLVGNALQHREADTPVLLSLNGTNGDTVTIEIKNQGSIPPEMMPVLFEPLSGGESKRRQGTKGLGLGLYISQQIVVSHGGSIHAESEPNQRQTGFIVKLPRKPTHNTEQVFGANRKEET